MLFHSYKPAVPLSDFVENLWAYKGFEAPCLRERILPSGTFELVFNLNHDQIQIYKATQPDECVHLSGAIASGPYTGFFVTDTALEASIIGVHFKPGGAFRFLGLAADELADRHIDLETIWGRAAAEIRDFDQSHLIRDFVAFSGCTPGDYVRASMISAGATCRPNSTICHSRNFNFFQYRAGRIFLA